MNPGLTIERAPARPRRARPTVSSCCLIVQREIANSIFMARVAESSVRELLNDADGYFYFVQRPSLHGRAPVSSTPAGDFFLFGSVAITRPKTDDDDMWKF